MLGGSLEWDDARRSLSQDHPGLISRQSAGEQLGLPGRDLLYPKYSIHNYAAYLPSWNGAEGGLSNHTVNTDVIHQNGLAMYDTHNLYVSDNFIQSYCLIPLQLELTC